MELQTVKLVACAIKSAREYLENKGYTEITVPRMVRASGACENINTLFEVAVDKNFSWFKNRRAYLAQTGQLYLEALVPALGSVYTIGPSFRAEPKADNRHLTEFQMLEIEFPGGFDDLLAEIENVINSIARGVVKANGKIGLSKENLKRLALTPERFPKINYDEAIKLLIRLGIKKEWGDDIPSEQEQLLVRYHDNQPIFITRFPDPMWDFKKELEVEKFFNMLPDQENPGRVLSADLILPYGGESVGAAARVHEAKVLVQRLKNSKMFKRLIDKGGSINDFGWYISRIENEGSVPHAGCGFGLARIIQWIKGASDIRECVSFLSNKENII